MDIDESALHEMTKRLQDTQERFLLVQQELVELEVTGSAGGGLVTVRMRGTGEITRVVIDQAAVDRGDAESLSDLMLTAIRAATEAVKSATSEKVSYLSDGLPASLGVPRRSTD